MYQTRIRDYRSNEGCIGKITPVVSLFKKNKTTYERTSAIIILYHAQVYVILPDEFKDTIYLYIAERTEAKAI